MLKTEQERKENGDFVVKAEKGSSGAGLFHKWYARFEEHGIVVITNEAIPTVLFINIASRLGVLIDVLGGERPNESSEFI